ncbi:CUB and sushi domain-containing protein 3 [Lamellibrachia satsuma]|nr:CUB and sushi domain-containing protein 3 [Lamellibrachia satsuma]
MRQRNYGDSARSCRSIVVYDANAKSPWALMLDMPTGWYTRRREVTCFQQEPVHRYGRMAVECGTWSTDSSSTTCTRSSSTIRIRAFGFSVSSARRKGDADSDNHRGHNVVVALKCADRRVLRRKPGRVEVFAATVLVHVKTDPVLAQSPVIIVEITCGEPRQIEHSKIRVTGRKLNAKAIYTCDTGYEQESGNNTAVCRESGHWSDVTIVCREVTCGTPPQPLHTLVMESGKGANGRADYVCEKGYRLTSSTTLSSCTSQGLWTDVTIKCQPITCPVISTAHVVIVNQTGDQLDDIMTLECEFGYRYVSGSITRTCLWTRDWPGVPTTYKGYRAVGGDFSRVCQGDGTWSEIDCITHPVVPNAHTENLTATTFMATAQYACDEGYKVDVIGAPLVCGKSASWLGEPLVCSEIQCAMPAPLVNTYVEAKSLNYKSTIVYKCHKGFAMTYGGKHRTCQSDCSWNGTEPNCAIMRCSDPPTVANTTWCVDKKSFEQRVIYKCLPRFELVSGELAKVCSSDLQWTGEDPVCVEISGDWDYVIKEDEPKTPKEKMMAKFGYKKSDEKMDHVAIGVVASVLLVLSIAVVVALDGPLLIAHLKILRRNVSYGMRRLRGRGTVSPESHHAPVDGP